MNKLLQELADKIGIVTKFHDAGTLKKEYTVDEKVIKFFVKELGYDASNDKAIEDSLRRIERKKWLNSMDSIYVRNQNEL